MLALYVLAGVLLWFLLGVLCGMACVAIDARMQEKYRFIEHDVRRVVGDNWALFALISCLGPIGWAVLIFAAWRGWI